MGINIYLLNRDELIRYAQPATDLEVCLLDKLKESLEELEQLEIEAEAAREERDELREQLKAKENT